MFFSPIKIIWREFNLIHFHLQHTLIKDRLLSFLIPIFPRPHLIKTNLTTPYYPLPTLYIIIYFFLRLFRVFRPFLLRAFFLVLFFLYFLFFLVFLFFLPPSCGFTIFNGFNSTVSGKSL